MITYIFLLVCGVDLLFKIHRAFLLRTRERAVVLLAKPPGTESVKGRKQVKVTNYNNKLMHMKLHINVKLCFIETITIILLGLFKICLH